MPDYANVLVKVVVILGVIKRVPATTSANNVFCYSAVAHIVTPLVNLTFRPKSGFKNKCHKYFLQYSTFASKKNSGSNMETPNLLLVPGAI